MTFKTLAKSTYDHWPALWLAHLSLHWFSTAPQRAEWKPLNPRQPLFRIIMWTQSGGCSSLLCVYLSFTTPLAKGCAVGMKSERELLLIFGSTPTWSTPTWLNETGTIFHICLVTAAKTSKSWSYWQHLPVKTLDSEKCASTVSLLFVFSKDSIFKVFLFFLVFFFKCKNVFGKIKEMVSTTGAA